MDEGGIYGRGCKEVYRLPHITYPYSCICCFLEHHPYFLFIFYVLEEACGKTLGERSSLMAERWRSLSVEEKEVYERRVQAVKETPMGVLSAKEKKVIMMRIARRHQADVSSTCVCVLTTTCVLISTIIIA